MTASPIPPHRCFVLFERFYVRLLSKLMNNFERKRWLQPLTYVYIDYPFTKRKKTYATLSSMEQFKVSTHSTSIPSILRPLLTFIPSC